jgi:hypothetical protein
MSLGIHNPLLSIVERISWALHDRKISSRRIYLRFGPSRCSISQDMHACYRLSLSHCISLQ